MLKKVHRVITFDQKSWLKLYIDMNFDLRKAVENFFKLMNNSVFGKTMEVIRKHSQVTIV